MCGLLPANSCPNGGGAAEAASTDGERPGEVTIDATGEARLYEAHATDVLTNLILIMGTIPADQDEARVERFQLTGLSGTQC